LTLAELQQKRDEIVATIGILRVQYGERSVQYSDQARALAAIDAEIARLQQPQRSVSYAEFSKG
jgi:hypothetical protein